MGAIAPRQTVFEGIRDGFYWVEWEGDKMVAERLGGEWYFPGFEDGADSEDDVTVLSGPLSPPKVPR